jgi:hypothetical protein
MILRRVITHFRKQEWTAFGTAFTLATLTYAPAEKPKTARRFAASNGQLRRSPA